MTQRRHFLNTLLVGAAAPSGFAASMFALHAKAQPALLKQLVIVVTFPAGGATDAAARIVGEQLRGTYAENVIVENRAGASGRIGTEYVKNAKPDGSVMLYTPAFPMAIFPHIYKKLNYDTLTDFAPVASTSKGMFGLAIGPAVPASVKTVQEFVAWCKANPDRANFGTASGSGQHFAGVMFARAAGMDYKLVPYKGGAPAVVDLLGGHVSSTVSPLPEIMPQAAEGKIRIVAVTGARRSRFLPDVPTMGEAGYKDVVFQDWSGFLAPARTPPELVAKAGQIVSSFIGSDKGVDALAKIGTEADAQSGPQFVATVRQSWERYKAVVGSTGFTAED